MTIPNFECTSLPKYGAGLIPLGDIAGSQILIKFHSNLEQIGKGQESIDEDYNLFGTIGSEEYICNIIFHMIKYIWRTDKNIFIYL